MSAATIRVRKVTTIDTASVHVGSRLRAANMDAVQSLAGSIAKIGLQSPITIRWVDEVDLPGEGLVSNVPVLVAGLHRLEAVRSLGLAEIEAFEFRGDEIDAKRLEIAENLHRTDLTEAEKREQLAAWIKLTEEKLAISHHGGEKSKSETNPKGAGRSEGGIEAAARELGIAPTTARRAVKAESLPDEAKAIADEAGLGTVDRAKAASAADPVAAVREMARPRVMSERESAERGLEKLMSVWGRVTTEAQGRFVEYVLSAFPAPVLDASNGGTPKAFTLVEALGRQYDPKDWGEDCGSVPTREEYVADVMIDIIGTAKIHADTDAPDLSNLLGGKSYIEQIIQYREIMRAWGRKRKKDASNKPVAPSLDAGA